MNKDLAVLPKQVKVKILKEGKVFIAELEELNAFTEADSLADLDFMINDLIFAAFDVPISGVVVGRTHFEPAYVR